MDNLVDDLKGLESRSLIEVLLSNYVPYLLFNSLNSTFSKTPY